ncbi:MAG: multidrug efflux SMR transporter [Candidatus Methanomethylophilaceae archaeon]|nr:multidrug efflux SMR transporter [Candidatus Methanomethylophilaceae archaeon]
MSDWRRLWLYLFIASMCEIIWAVALGYSDGFRVLPLSAVVLIFLTASIYLLSKAISGGLPVGTAYAVWVGIGAVGTMTVSVILGNEPALPMKLLFVGFIIAGIVGLQITSCEKAQN